MSTLIIRHAENNTLGALENVLQAYVPDLRYLYGRDLIDADLSLSGVTGLIVLGGMESVTEEGRYPFMSREQQLIRNAVEQDLPVLGICLGSQMLAHALGGRVERNTHEGKEVKEIGWVPLHLTEAGKADPVLSVLGGCPQFQWHEDTFHLPPEAVLLVQTELCPRQAFRLNKGGKPVYGVQFHPEVTEEVIDLWIRQSRTITSEQAESIRRETAANFATYHAASRAMFEAFCRSAFG